VVRKFGAFLITKQNEMDIQEFKALIDNRDTSRFDEMWQPAENWVDAQNDRETKSNVEWRFDCGFKLDFDGDIMHVSSRFYPPHKSSSDFGKWHGNVTVVIGEYEIDDSSNVLKKEFEASTLDELQRDVEVFVGRVESLSKEVILSAKDRFLSLLR
jgi:hypothetical protein